MLPMLLAAPFVPFACYAEFAGGWWKVAFLLAAMLFAVSVPRLAKSPVRISDDRQRDRDAI